MENNHLWKITCLFYGTLTAPKGIFCAGIDEDKVMFLFVFFQCVTQFLYR